MHSLRQGLDRDIQKVVQKLEDEADQGSKPKARLTVSDVYEAIQISNSSLRRHKKRPLEHSIERVLAGLREDAIDADSAAPAGEDPATSTPTPGKKRKRSADPAGIPRNSAKSETRPTESPDRPPHPAAAPTEKQGGRGSKSSASRRPRTKPYVVEGPDPAALQLWGGLAETFASLTKFVHHTLNPARELDRQAIFRPTNAILISGPPGVGKHSLVRAVAAKTQRPILDLCDVFTDPEMMEKNLSDALEEARSLGPCIVLIAEMDEFVARVPSGSGYGDPHARCVAKFVRFIDKVTSQSGGGAYPHALVMATTSRMADIEPKVLRLFVDRVYVPLPDLGGREEILRLVTDGHHRLAPDFDFGAHVKNTHGYVGRDLHNVTRQAMYQGMCVRYDQSHPGEDHDHNHDPWHHPAGAPAPLDWITNQDMAEAIRSYTPQSRQEGFSIVPDTTWSQVGALARVRERLSASIIRPILNPAGMAQFDLGKSAGVLLWGPPGCGKTLVAKAVANEAQANLIIIHGPELLNKYVGESERAVRELFGRARAAAPCILFFDEMDSLVPKRENSSTDAGARVVNAFLTELDGAHGRTGVYVIGTTNRPDMMDEAMLRPGRLDKKLFLDLPTVDERVEILQAIVRTKVASESAVDVTCLERVARDLLCDNFSGADLTGLYFEAAEQALRRGGAAGEVARLIEEDWQHALQNTQSSVKNPEDYRHLASII